MGIPSSSSNPLDDPANWRAPRYIIGFIILCGATPRAVVSGTP